MSSCKGGVSLGDTAVDEISNASCVQEDTEDCQSATCCEDAPVYACQENHTLVQVIKHYSSIIKAKTSWNVPACNASTSFEIANSVELLSGSYLWNETYGYFEIVSTTGTSVVVRNICADGNATPGTLVPECTGFIVTDPPQETNCGQDIEVYPYVATTFSAPADSACLAIDVTSVNGLVVGQNVGIAGGTYLVDSINSDSSITVCNEGDGLPEGTVVTAQTEDGCYQYRVTPVDDSLCVADSVTSGKMLVCKDGVPTTLSGSTDGSVPVYDSATSEVSLKVLDIPVQTCTILTACLTLIPGTLTYTITVDDTSEFVAGDFISIVGFDGYFIIDTVVDDTHLEITANADPGVFIELQVGANVCELTCCERIDLGDVLVFDTLDLASVSGELENGESLQTAVYTVTVVNNTPFPRSIFYNMESHCEASSHELLPGAARMVATYRHEIFFDFNNPAPVTVVQEQESTLYLETFFERRFDTIIYRSGVVTVAPGDTIDLNFRSKVTWQSAVDFSYDIAALFMRLQYIAVAL